MLGFVPLFLLAATAVGRSGAPPERAAWTVIVDCDAVRVERDAAGDAAADVRTRDAGSAPLRARLRWSIRDAAVSPSAWTLGVRTTLDDVEVDCVSGASRTLASHAFAADGAPLVGAGFSTVSPTWKAHAPATLGGMIADAVCRAAGRTVGIDAGPA